MQEHFTAKKNSPSHISISASNHIPPVTVAAGPDLAGGRPGAKLTWGVTKSETVKALGLKIHD